MATPGYGVKLGGSRDRVTLQALRTKAIYGEDDAALKTVQESWWFGTEDTPPPSGGPPLRMLMGVGT